MTSVRPVEAADTFWTIMSTLMLASASALKIAAASPGLSGTPTTVILASFTSAATPEMIGCSMALPSAIAASMASGDMTIVPVRCENDDRTWIGRLNRRAYSTQRRCSTLAPTAASSSISSYVMYGTWRAAGTTRGSALNTPSTSV